MTQPQDPAEPGPASNTPDAARDPLGTPNPTTSSPGGATADPGPTPTPPPSPPPGAMPPPPSTSPEGYGYQSAPPPQAYGYQQRAQQLSQQEERTWGMLAHLSALIGLIIGVSFVGPLVVMLVQGPKSRFVRDQAVEALNFNITVLIAIIVSAILILLVIGIVLLPIVGIAWLVFTIIGAVTANDGRPYRYPINIRMVK